MLTIKGRQLKYWQLKDKSVSLNYPFKLAGNYSQKSGNPISETLHFKHFYTIMSAVTLSDEGPMLETLDYTIRIGSTPTFLYFDLYLYSAYAAHYVYFKWCHLATAL